MNQNIHIKTIKKTNRKNKLDFFNSANSNLSENSIACLNQIYFYFKAQD